MMVHKHFLKLVSC